jgi:hypothetical protein
VSVQALENKCAICQAVFGDWHGFNTHHQMTHGVFGRKIVPERTTNRTKAQIVADFETRNANLFALGSPETGLKWVG